MSTGRTNWWTKDAAWWRRAGVAELGQEHGPAGPAVLDWLTCEARSQNPQMGTVGEVRSGYAAIAHGCFIDQDTAKAVVAMAVEIGLLDDFEDHGRTFTCRISGWREDVELPLDADRKRQARAAKKAEDEAGQTGTSPDVSEDVRERPPASPTRQDKTKTTSSLRSEDARAGDERKGRRRRPEPVDADSLPDDLPERLHPVAEQVVAVLSRVAGAKGAKPVTRAAVGRAVAAFPDHNHARLVGEFEHWWLHGNGEGRQMRDVVLTYRNRLDAVPAEPGAAARLQVVPNVQQARTSAAAFVAAQQRALGSNGEPAA